MKHSTLICATVIVTSANAKWNGLPPAAVMDFGAMTRQNIVAASEPTVVENPFHEDAKGIKLFANGYYRKEVEEKAIPALQGNQTLIEVAKRVANIPSFFWL
jgi:hypothetical protein